MWELAGEQKQSRSKGPGNNLQPISCCRCAQHSLFLPRLEQSGFISTSPHLFQEGPMPWSRTCPRLGRWRSWLRSHTSCLTPHRPQRFPLNPAFHIPIKEAPFATAGSHGPAPPPLPVKRGMSRTPERMDGKPPVSPQSSQSSRAGQQPGLSLARVADEQCMQKAMPGCRLPLPKDGHRRRAS